MKIFGIGLSNTGTRSLSKALSILGFKTIHYPWSFEQIEEHQASTDIPVSARYKKLDLIYPNSKFILTIRPIEEWIERRRLKPPDKGPISNWMAESRMLLYGSIVFDQEKYTEAYINYHKEVEKYFHNRKSDLLILPLSEKNKWNLICDFLNKDIPRSAYPWEGKSKKKKIL